jgi:hypothetical protein
MKLTIPDEVRRETERCPHDFSCLTTGKCGALPMCEIDRRIDKNWLFVKTSADTERFDCPYKYTYGIYGRICTCPTRYSLSLREPNQLVP